MIHQANDYVSALGAEIGIPRLALDEHGRCRLKFDDVTVELDFDSDVETFFVSAALGRLPQDAALEMAQRLLEANLFWRGTGGATLALAGPAHDVVLLKSLPTSHLTIADFKSRIETFVSAAEHWMKVLATPTPVNLSTPSPSADWMKI